MLLESNYLPHAPDQLQAHEIIITVLKYFSDHYRRTITIPFISRDTGIPLVHIETAFDACKGKSASRALLEYRLNRLCDYMAQYPTMEIGQQIQQCGLSSFAQTNAEFYEHFGIDLVEFHKQCFLAAAARVQSEEYAKSVESEDIIGFSTLPEKKRILLHRDE